MELLALRIQNECKKIKDKKISMTKNAKILSDISSEILKMLSSEKFYGKIVVKLDVVDSNIAKKVEINNRNLIVNE
jgi:hypothetical protein